MNAKKVILIENTHFDFVSTLAYHNIQSEIDRMVEQGYFEAIPVQDYIFKYINIKPNNILGRRYDDQTYLLVIDVRDQIQIFRLA